MLQNFSGQNLRGRSFIGEDLTGANFSDADIQGVNFTNAILVGANLSNVKAGLKKRWSILLTIFSCLLAGLSGCFSAFTGYLVLQIFASSLGNEAALVSLMTTMSLIIIIIRFRGGVSFIFVFTFTLAGAFALAEALSGLAPNIAGTQIIASAFALAGTTTGAAVFGVAFCIAELVAGNRVANVASILALTFALYLSVTLAGVGNSVLAAASALFFLNSHISSRVLDGDERYALILKIATRFAAIGGTSFYNANLTDANFRGATLENTDLRKANLTRTCFHQIEKLSCASSSSSYLEQTELLEVLLTGEGANKDFARQDLRGVNFHGCFLKDANFQGADLSNANLQDADLSRAKLVKTQLDGTDFTGATLTGAYIEDWNITSSTNFTGVRCEYIYMRQPTKENPDPYRKPDNREEVFRDGEFGDFIQPIFDTLDLYHSQGVDPRAIAVAFKQLAQNHPSAELEIVAIERRGDNKILLRAKTVATANKSELSQEYFLSYNQVKALAEQDFTALIAYQKSEISRLENMINTALEHPNFYSRGDIIMSKASKKQSTFNLQGAQFGGGLVDADTVHANQIGGNITNYTTEQKQNLAQAAVEIQQLLTQLEQTNPTTTSAQKMTVVAQAVDKIEKNPTLKARVIGALKSGGIEALKEAVNHPLVNVFIAAVEGWQDVE